MRLGRIGGGRDNFQIEAKRRRSPEEDSQVGLGLSVGAPGPRQYS